jgi:hypothetical protein
MGEGTRKVEVEVARSAPVAKPLPTSKGMEVFGGMYALLYIDL